MLNNNIENINNKYLVLLINYTNFFFKNIDLYKNISFLENLYIKGLNIIQNIFNISLLHLENISDIYNLCEKGYIYFIEFINQINLSNSIENNFELTIKDAIIFCYKKTILLFENKLNNSEKNDSSQLYNIIHSYTNILGNIFIIINANNYNIIKKNNYELHNEELLLSNLMQNLNENNKKINKLNKKINDTINFNSLSSDNYEIIINFLRMFLEFINKINNTIENKTINNDIFVIILERYLIKNILVLNNKIMNYDSINNLVNILTLDIDNKANIKNIKKIIDTYFV
tara:strand:+ start:46 stop:909 length:864 start_codon:yes stop_codon:yes gene_type:complete